MSDHAITVLRVAFYRQGLMLELAEEFLHTLALDAASSNWSDPTKQLTHLRRVAEEAYKAVRMQPANVPTTKMPNEWMGHINVLVPPGVDVRKLISFGVGDKRRPFADQLADYRKA